MVDLETTNWILGAIALASAIQTMVLVFLAVSGYKLYRQITQTVAELEVEHVAPLRHQIDGILQDVQAITARLSHQTERVDQVITGTMERVDETAERVRHSVRDKVSRATGIVRGIRAVLTSLLATESRPKTTAEGRA
jgi:uncharacterized protein YoxC